METEPKTAINLGNGKINQEFCEYLEELQPELGEVDAKQINRLKMMFCAGIAIGLDGAYDSEHLKKVEEELSSIIENNPNPKTLI